MAAGFPAVGLCAFLLWYDGYSAQIQWTVDLFLVLLWLGIAFNLKQRIVRPLQTLSNILAAIREGDYSIRGRRALTGDALGEVMLEVNDALQALRMLDRLEDLDDVQRVYSNADFPEEALAAYSS